MIFKKKRDDGTYVQMRISEDATWAEAADEFVYFLQGCGYIVQGIEVAEHLMDQYAFQKEERKVCRDTTKKEKSKK
ncbi:hypothetical protein EB118_04235 [bacterium]|nr:hypothetical protein [bacterium]